MEAARGVVLGFDVGRYSHHMTAIDARTGEVVASRGVEQTEPDIREAIEPYALGDAAVVVDQPGDLSSLLLAVARDMGLGVGFITPRAMAKGIELYGGELKSDAHDSFVIADLAARIPSLVRPVPERRADVEELASLMSYDRELTDDVRRAASRIHELPLATCPALGAVYAGQRVKQRLPLAMLARFGGAGGLSAAGRGEVEGWARGQPRCGARGLAFVGSALDAVGSQGVATTSSPFYDELLRIEAASLRSALDAREAVGARVDELLGRIPDAQVLLSMPGVGRVTAATFVSEVPDVGAFASAAKLAAYAGLAPRVRQSGRSLNSVTRPRAGNRRLKRALVLSAARSVDFCEESRAYYDRKRSEGRCHYSAVVALARRRINVMYAMLRDGKRYESRLG
ncbi:IS110 family transposase [Parafannyhessea umbonata]|jgi:transposase|uniref:IS110 family transposase n=1 Tax=Parafannyhessea umbonata TaxID=604330 RepID=UPI0029F02BC6|nr:IS110 family transposase [Atopobiaceae bacterium]MCH4120376.1 IS110 family transposase [Atopobiaceae bacterium]MCI1389414.1 IS110 family transposase [Atopobiaceae bacterium]MCI1432305.1 IS110 family transposase [Atopobiaceae bacterium]MCI1470763.1 IS110 family transposase [Atopobiaceae bacterium]